VKGSREGTESKEEMVGTRRLELLTSHDVRLRWSLEPSNKTLDKERGLYFFRAGGFASDTMSRGRTRLEPGARSSLKIARLSGEVSARISRRGSCSSETSNPPLAFLRLDVHPVVPQAPLNLPYR
jgi:hypothetical protein